LKGFIFTYPSHLKSDPHQSLVAQLKAELVLVLVMGREAQSVTLNEI
jgi:hypothetical protein